MKNKDNITFPFFNLSEDFLAIITIDGYIQKHNKTWVKKLGYTNEELSSKPFWDFAQDGKKLSQFFKQNHFEELKVDSLFLAKNNDLYLLEWRFEFQPQENLVYALAKENKLLNNQGNEEQLLNDIFQSLTVGVIKTNLQGEIIYANSEASNILDLEIDDITHKFYNSKEWNQIDLEGNPLPTENLPITLAIRERKAVKNIQHGIIANNVVKWLSVNASPLYNNEKEMIGVIASFQDITQNVKGNIALHKSYKELENFKYALDESALVSITDINGNFIYVNSTFCKVSKYSHKELMGRNYNILDSGFHETSFFDEMWLTLKQGKVWRAEIKKQASDNSFFWVSTVITPLFDDKGKIYCYLEIDYDITKRKLAEQQLQEREEMLESIHNNMKDGIYRSSSKKGLVYVSPGFIKLFGYKSEAEVYDINPNNLYKNLEDRISLREKVIKLQYNQQSLNKNETVFRRKDGTTFIGLVTFRVVKNENDEIIYDGIIKDITESKRVEEENAKLALLAQETDNMVIITDAKGCIEWINAGFIKKMGLDWEIIGKKISDIFVYTQTDITVHETILQSLEVKKKKQVEIGVFSKDRQKISLQVNILPIFGMEGGVKNVILILNDVTSLKQKTEELENLSKDLIRRNEGLEQFNYIVSHNVRSQVANIIGLMEIYDKKNPMNEFNQTIIEHLEESAEKLDIVIKDLNDILELRHHLNEKKQIVYFMDLYIEIIRSIEHQIERAGSVIDVDFQEAPNIFTVKSYLQSILFNLISNAIKYKSQYRKNIIKITTKNDSKYIILTVKDNGVGIDLKRDKEKIFGLYQKLQTYTEGKGMGLFIVKTQVEALEGKIEVESKLNEGTKFIVYLKK